MDYSKEVVCFDAQIPVSKKNKKERYQEDLEERLVSLIASLFGKQASELLCEFRLRMSCLVGE